MRRRLPDARVILGAIFVASAVARIVIATQRETPLYYPDEYVYTSLARSIADTGVPSLRGVAWHFPAFLGPYLMAPAWWISNISVAYHVVLSLGAIWFSAAAFPAYALGRRVGLSSRGALIVALFAVLVPDAAFASTALSEPYAYPLFLATVVVLIDAIAYPTLRRQVGMLVLIGVLCLLRAQFVVIPLAYLVTAAVHARGSVRGALRAQWLVVTAVVLGAAFVLALGPSRAAGFYSDYLSHRFGIGSLLGWVGLNFFVLLIAAGWAFVPGAVVGLASLLGSDDTRHRVFAAFTIALTVVLLFEASYPSTGAHRTYERYVFYAAPLLVTACVWAIEAGTVPRAYALIAYALAAAAVVVPALEPLHSSDTQQSPSLLWLHDLSGGGSTAGLVWAIGLALAAVAVAQLRDRPVVALVLGLVVTVALTGEATRALLRFVPLELRAGRSRPIEAFKVAAPDGSALVTWEGTDRFILMKTLFWSPKVDRVLVVGGGDASDGYASTPVHLVGRGGVADAGGGRVAGPFALPVDTSVAGTPRAWVPRWPSAVVLGLDREDRFLNVLSQLLVSPREKPVTVSLRLAAGSPRTLTFKCPSGRTDVRVGQTPHQVRLRFAAATRCRISLTKGAAAQGTAGITSGVRVLSFVVA